MTTQEQDDATLVRKLIREILLVYGHGWSNHSVFHLAMRCVQAGRQSKSKHDAENAMTNKREIKCRTGRE